MPLEGLWIGDPGKSAFETGLFVCLQGIPFADRHLTRFADPLDSMLIVRRCCRENALTVREYYFLISLDLVGVI